MQVSFEGEFGLQFVLSLLRTRTVPELVELAHYGREVGFSQVWVDDHVGSRNQTVVLSAIAARAPMKLGTAIMVPYYRNPVVTATALASISELIAPHELSVGLARGGIFRPIRPITMLAETAQFLHRALAGDTVRFGEFPFLATYYHLDPDRTFRLDFAPKAPVLLYCGGNAPKSLAVGGRFMDGLLFGGPFMLMHRSGRVKGLLDIAESAAREASPHKRLRKVAEINLSLSSDLRAARDFARPYVAGLLRWPGAGGAANDFLKLGIDPDEINGVRDALAKGVPREEAAALVTDAMVDAMFIAGDLSICKERIMEVCQAAVHYGFDQLSFTKLGPDCGAAIRLLSQEILPMLKRA